MDGIITTVAGLCSTYTGPRFPSGGYSGDGEQATKARLNLLHGVAVDSASNIYIADSENFRVRRVSADGIITTIAADGVWCCSANDQQNGAK